MSGHSVKKKSPVITATAVVGLLVLTGLAVKRPGLFMILVLIGWVFLVLFQ